MLGIKALSRLANRILPGGASSRMPALSVPMAAPAARPCMIRATYSQATPCAAAKTIMAAVSSPSAPMSTGRRPTKSDNPPTVSNEASSATA